MNKYIDAEKLIKSVKNYQEGAKCALNPIDGKSEYYRGKIDACDDIQDFITDRQKLPSPQSHWKPSEYQMKALYSLVFDGGITYVSQLIYLKSLYEDLKSL